MKKSYQITAQEATITTRQHQGKIAQNRKEKHFYRQLTAVNSVFEEIVVLRFYGTQAKNYACLWVHDSKNNIWICGGGSASGYGYHRESSAADSAIADAGIKLSVRIDGVGDSAVKEAVFSIMKAIGYFTDDFGIVEAHA